METKELTCDTEQRHHAVTRRVLVSTEVTGVRILVTGTLTDTVWKWRSAGPAATPASHREVSHVQYFYSTSPGARLRITASAAIMR